MLSVGSILTVSGFVTDEKFIRGQTMKEIEKRLGFHTGRLQKGATFALLVDYPSMNSFDLQGYSQVAGHHFDEQYGNSNLDTVRVKRNVLKSWQSHHAKLVKVLPTIRHDRNISDDEQYPSGSGVPQWKISGHDARIVAIFDANAYQRNRPYQRQVFV